MKDIGHFNKIILAVTPVDFRKQSYGLAALAQNVLNEKVSDSRVLFMFTNRQRSAVRLLYWDQTGFAMWSKVLEKDRFKWPRSVAEAKIVISQREVKWLLQGVDVEKIKVHSPVDFSSIS
jgi:transposase